MKQHKISIIIPILNEADSIRNLLNYLTLNSSVTNIAEIIVADGGSNDKSQNIVETFHKKNKDSEVNNNSPDHNIIFVSAPKRRSKQMNVGAKMATGTILYFLHADSYPPKHFDTFIIQEVEKNNEAGCFKMKFDNKHWWLKLSSWFTQFNWRPCRGGDQSQFITKTLFDDIGGYDENYIIYEDNILINELFKRKEFVVIQKSLITSSRLYTRIGIWKLQYHFLAIYVRRWLGASADELYNYYLKHIAQ